MNVLVTGGAGFIGSHLVDSLIQQGYSVTVYDNLEQQVHGGRKPGYLNKHASYIYDDIRDYDAFRKALSGVEAVFHFASMVGVGQSQYQIRKYMEVNSLGTANLWDIIANNKNRIKKVIISSSMSSYGEGLCLCAKCGTVKPQLREDFQLKNKDWQLYCPNCKEIVRPIPTTEDTLFCPNSTYALSKKIQEDISIISGRTYGVPVVSLRFFNVYGSRQSLSNPYTGVAAIFISRLKNSSSPVIFEDGLQSRDFVSVKDIVRASIQALELKSSDYQICNLGSSKPIAIKDMAVLLSGLLGKDIKPKVVGGYRKGDIRHCYADTAKAKAVLNWQPEVELTEGLKELVCWANNEPSFDMFNKALDELADKNLVKF
ncbi:MAG: SDR family NAD(P)-dependent oxidoreductase [Candidatus Omnitrophica bacterium]|nr:SDR family NAD(P)-dependent oxidoreductase [Candidatus Omnitrophota bacterium]